MEGAAKGKDKKLRPSTRRHKEREALLTPFVSLHKDRILEMSANLHLRLQYAALKVERGWSTLSIDEVENLYFHKFRSQAERRDADAAEDQRNRELEPPPPGGGGSAGRLNFDQLEVDVEALLHGCRRSDAGDYLGGASGSEDDDEQPREPPGRPSSKLLGKRKAVDHPLASERPIRPRPSYATADLSSAASTLSFAPSSSSQSSATTTSRPLSHLASPRRTRAPSLSGGTVQIPNTYEDFWKTHNTTPGSPGRVLTSPFRSPTSLTPTGPSITVNSPTRPRQDAYNPFNPGSLGGGTKTLTAAASTSSLLGVQSNSSGSQPSLPASSNSNGSGSAFGGKPLGSQASFTALEPPPPLPFDPEPSREPDDEYDTEDESRVVAPAPGRHLDASQTVDNDFPNSSQDLYALEGELDHMFAE